MAEERSAGRNRRSRRRYFQPKKDKGATPPGPGEPARPVEQKAPPPKARKARRRARSRQRLQEETRAASLEPDVAYVAPKTVYIYECSIHPELRDAYEFRPEHFSKIGRTLNDYQIDLIKLFPDDAVDADGMPIMVNMLPEPVFNWEDWEEEN